MHRGRFGRTARFRGTTAIRSRRIGIPRVRDGLHADAGRSPARCRSAKSSSSVIAHPRRLGRARPPDMRQPPIARSCPPDESGALTPVPMGNHGRTLRRPEVGLVRRMPGVCDGWCLCARRDLRDASHGLSAVRFLSNLPTSTGAAPLRRAVRQRSRACRPHCRKRRTRETE